MCPAVFMASTPSTATIAGPRRLPLELQRSIVAAALEDCNKQMCLDFMTVTKEFLPLARQCLYSSIDLDDGNVSRMRLLARTFREESALGDYVQSIKMRSTGGFFRNWAPYSTQAEDDLCTILKSCKPQNLSISHAARFSNWFPDIPIPAACCMSKAINVLIDFDDHVPDIDEEAPDTVWQPWTDMITRAKNTIREVALYGVPKELRPQLAIPICPNLASLIYCNENSIVDNDTLERILSCNANWLSSLSVSASLDVLLRTTAPGKALELPSLQKLHLAAGDAVDSENVTLLGLYTTLRVLGLNHWGIDAELLQSLTSLLDDPAWLPQLQRIELELELMGPDPEDDITQMLSYGPFSETCKKRGITIT